MFKRAFIASAFIVALSVPAMAQQVQCVPMAVFNSVVEFRHGEEPIAQGRSGDYTVRIYADTEDRSFTVVILDKERTRACAIASGEGFRPVVPADIRDEPPIVPSVKKRGIPIRTLEGLE